MATLLSFRDGVKDFCSKYDKFVSPLCKFLLAIVMFWSIAHLTGYNSTMSSFLIVIAASFVCAFLPESLTIAIGGLYACAQVASASLEIGITFVIIFVIMYCIYVRFFPKASWLIMFMPFFYIIRFSYFMPLLAGMLLGVTGMIPAAFGCVFYYFMKYTSDYVKLSANTSEENLVEGYKYIFEHLVQDKTLLLTIIVFAVVIVLTFIIYKMSFAYSWYVAIITGGVVEIVLFLVGTLSMETEISLAGSLLGCILAILVAIVVQFFKAVVDYSKVENTQFEDDEYYYYVKAVPKITSDKKKGAPVKNDGQRKAPAGKPAARPAGRPEGRPATRPAGRPEGTPAARPVARPEGRPAAKPVARPEETPVARPVASSQKKNSSPEGEDAE